MGWCSATPIFDKVAQFVLEADMPQDKKHDVQYTLAEALRNEDWDCEQDSRYWDNPFVNRILSDVFEYDDIDD